MARLQLSFSILGGILMVGEGRPWMMGIQVEEPLPLGTDEIVRRRRAATSQGPVSQCSCSCSYIAMSGTGEGLVKMEKGNMGRTLQCQ